LHGSSAEGTQWAKRQTSALTDRQRRELDYHKDHAASLPNADRPVDFSVVTAPKRRWWNAYWTVWTLLRNMPLVEKKVLVVGCGAGADALYFAKLGATVSAFDLSPDMLAHGIRRANENGLEVCFEQMAAENMTYPPGTFDVVFARDIMHHVDIAATMDEIVRVSKPGSILIMDEIYSHSFTDIIRHSWIVERLLYPKMTGFIYKGRKPYITEDERKMSEHDVAQVTAQLSRVQSRRFYNLLVTRLLPDTSNTIEKLDRIALMILGPLGSFLAGRVLLVGSLKKS
jgi:ubiquinone/menaquinone biosynthesis C-methylase UbiE